jgi:SET domain-containing protein
MPDASPHIGVHARLARSPIHGIGVFACEKILAGTNVFANDRREITWVPRSTFDDPGLTKFQRTFYKDFAIHRADELGCPANFNLLTVGWYVNEPEQGAAPNLSPTEDYELVAVRDIEAGEELTVLYSCYR